MANLGNLALELKYLIIDHLLIEDPLHSIIPLSGVNTTFRNLLAPRIFNTVTLRNTIESGNYFKSIADGPHAHHVKTVHYKALVTWPSHEYNEPLPSHFPAIIQEVLGSLCAKFPNLKTLRVYIPIEEDDFTEQFHEIEFDCSASAASESEHREGGWSEHVRETYAAISQNPPGQITVLEMLAVAPIHISSWDKPAFHAFLGGLERFEISFCGGDNGAGWQLSTTEYYPDFIGQISNLFFRHLVSVKRLSVTAEESGPVGENGEFSPAIFLDPGYMPLLTSLTLEFHFIDSELLDFLRAHKDTLSSLHLSQCYCSNISYAADPSIELSWSYFFQTLASTAPSSTSRLFSRLSSLVIEPVDIFKDEDFENGGYDHLKEDVQRVRGEIIAKGGWCRPFSYGCQDTKYGYLNPDIEWEIGRFRAGDDRGSYARCMAFVEENKKSNKKN
ncbi:hypothetical protein P154DRAFT_255805 [Amniculicola lignicola CBS 123094]|uniref:F-box domain-containing protein n=1 Tax=Amniculicola lignicola CBS 123094 TaxID=1392246 RepID=A0A6A5X2R3_9PLEO|nr:hypothetical protein P154DRAFT_255805 [Amniculicola lignicola CBS 123094]